MSDNSMIKKALPEIEEEYHIIRDLFEEAWNRKYKGIHTEFDEKYCDLSVKLLQTLGYLIEVLEDD